MQLDPVKVKKLEKLIGKTEVEVPEVPEWMYKRAQLKEIAGEQVPVFTRVRTRTIVVPASKIDAVVDSVCNGSEEAWIIKEMYPVAKRPGKTTGADQFLLLFLCVDEIVLPFPEEKEEEVGETKVDDETLKRAEEWEQQGS